MIPASGDQVAFPSASARPRAAIRASTARTVTIGERELLFFGGCGYLGLAHDERVLAALREATRRHGTSSGASRETTGNVVEHEALEREIAEALGLEDALLLPEGALANLALGETLRETLPEPPTRVFVDASAHPTILEAVRLAGASPEPRAALGAALAEREAGSGPALVWTDGVFPMEGRLADLRGVLDALDTPGSLLVVDDCHGLGVLGARGRGSLEAAGISDPRVIVTGTLSKALGAYGGFVAGAAERVADVRRCSGLYAGTTPLAPPLAAAARAALAILVAEPERVERQRASTRAFRDRLASIGVPLRPLAFPVAAFELESAARMQRVHEFALAEGVYLPFVRYAGAGVNGAFRIVWNAGHTEADLERLTGVLRRALDATAAEARR